MEVEGLGWGSVFWIQDVGQEFDLTELQTGRCAPVLALVRLRARARVRERERGRERERALERERQRTRKRASEGESARARKRESESVCVCVCACVCERERARFTFVSNTKPGCGSPIRMMSLRQLLLSEEGATESVLSC